MARRQRIDRAIQGPPISQFIAVFPVLADVVEVKTRSRSTAHWRIHLTRLNGWLRHSLAQLITLLDIDGIGQKWEDSNIITAGSQHRRESGAHALFLYWSGDPQFSNCLQRPPIQGKKACTRQYSTPLHTAKFPMQYRNDIRILELGAPLHSRSIERNCVHDVQRRPQ